jgi:hypothetical protein
LTARLLTTEWGMAMPLNYNYQLAKKMVEAFEMASDFGEPPLYTTSSREAAPLTHTSTKMPSPV